MDARKVIEIALAEVGYLEKSKTAYKNEPTVLYDKQKGHGQDNYTKYGYEMHQIYPSVMDFPAAWCDAFVDWCFYKAYGISTAKSLICGNFDDYTVNSKQMYVKKNAYYKSNPKVGDQIFFKNLSGKSVGHTGIVYAVDSRYVYTVEGNTSNSNEVISNGGCVAKKKYLLTNTRIDGYGRPKYSTGNSLDTTEKSTEQPKNDQKQYYKQYAGTSTHIDEVFKNIGVPSKYLGTYLKRKPIAIANGIPKYSGQYQENIYLIKLARNGKLLKV